MADGDKLLRITNPNNPMVALARNRRESKKQQAFIGSGNTVDGSDLGTSNVPRVETDDVTATLIPDHDGGGNWRPYIRVNVTGGYASTRSFVGYRVRVLPAIGAAFEIDGPAFPNTPIPIDIHNLPTPPHTSETWQLQVRVITSIWGAGFWSDYVPITWGGDPDAPAAPSFPSGWVILNVYDETQRISRFHIIWNQNTEPDLDRYILEYAIGTGGSGPLTGGDGPTTLTWVRLPPIGPETSRYDFDGVFAPSSVVNIRLLAQDTSGNQSPWTQQPPVTMAPEPAPTPPDGNSINFIGDHGVGLNQYVTTLTWTDSTDPNCAEYNIAYYQSGQTPTVLTHISKGGLYTMPPLAASIWFFKIQSVTTHGLAGNWSTPIAQHILGGGINDPTGLHVVSNVWSEQRGHSEVTVNWNTVITATQYRVLVTLGALVLSFATGGLSYTYPTAASTNLTIAVQALDQYGNASAGTNGIPVTSAPMPVTTELYNPSFEFENPNNPGSPDGWYNDDFYGTQTTVWSSVYSHSGVRSMRVTNPSGSFHQIYSRGVYVTPGRQYSVSVQGRGSGQISMAVWWYDALGNSVFPTMGGGSTAVNGSGWTETSTLYVTPPTGTVYAVVKMGFSDGGLGSYDLWVDSAMFWTPSMSQDIGTQQVGTTHLNPAQNIGVGTNSPENVEGWNRTLETYGTGHAKSQVRTSGGITSRLWSHDAGYNGMSAGGGIGTQSNHPFHLYSNNTKRMTLNADGSINVYSTMKNNGGIYQLEMSGDQYGGTRLELLNRGGANGVRYTLVPDDTSIQLIDFILGHPGGTRNIRLEGRVGFCVLGTAQEFQYGDPSAFHTYISSAGLYQSSGYIQGAYKSADGSIGVSTTVTLAKVTTGGTNGSMTIKNGVITSITNPT